jgi:hypothetical protein
MQKIAPPSPGKRLRISTSSGCWHRVRIQPFDSRQQSPAVDTNRHSPEIMASVGNFAANCALSQPQIDKSGWNSLNSSVLLIH